MKKVYYVGLDVHKETIEMAVYLNDAQGPVEKHLNNDQARIIKELKKLQQNGEVIACYEAGCMGFTLHRAMSEAGIECRVLSPGHIPIKTGVRIKTDRRDARNLAKYLRTGEAEGIYIPSAEDEATRDYIRTRDDFRQDLKRAKQQLLKFFLRLGYRYEGTRYWTVKHVRWMKAIEFSQPLHRETFYTYFTRMRELEERLAIMDARIIEIAQGERYRTAVKMLRCFKGIDYLVALAFVCEVGNFKRFPSASSFMSYLGLIPQEHSSGETRRQGRITKSGNAHLRRLLVEAGWHYRYAAVPSKKLTARRIGNSIEIVAYADKALRRLQKKFAKMLLKGKTKNSAVIAVSRELAGFIWGAMTNKIMAPVA